MTGSMAAQTAAPAAAHSTAEIAALIKDLLPKAQASSTGVASQLLDKFPGGTLQLFVRAGKDGGGEIHQNLNDVFFVVDGEANVLTGGTVPDAKETAPGEPRGSKVEGGTSHILHKGDVLHIDPGVAHQTLLLDKSKPFVYFVVKVQKQ